MKKTLGVLLIASCLTAPAVQAEGLNFFFSLGYDFGGEKLATVIYEDGGSGSLRINEGAIIGVGLALPLGGGVDLQSSIAYQGVAETASNGELSWRSYPWETSVIATLGQFQIGGGVIYHFSPEFKSEGDLAVGDIEFDDALGYQAQIAYLINTSVANGLALGLKYTSVDFEKNQYTINGDSTAFFVKLHF